MQGQGEQNRCQVFPVTIGTGSKGRRSRPALTHMEDVERALRPTKLIVAQANVEDDRLLCPGQIGNAKQILGFEIGDDDRGALAQDFLRLGGYVAVGGEQVAAPRPSSLSARITASYSAWRGSRRTPTI